MVNSMTLKECYLLSIKGFMKTGLFGCGMSGSGCTNKFKEWRFINGSVSIYITVTNCSQWSFKTKNKEKITSV